MFSKNTALHVIYNVAVYLDFKQIQRMSLFQHARELKLEYGEVMELIGGKERRFKSIKLEIPSTELLNFELL